MNDHAPTTEGLLDADRRHLIHPLHRPKDHVQARIFVEGRGAMLRTADGTEYIDGLGGRVVAEAMKRGLIIRQRGGGGAPVSGDSLCIAPPLITAAM
jgi:adenosylmethionine-8-amino-7-oxononanoate aminotransferase